MSILRSHYRQSTNPGKVAQFLFENANAAENGNSPSFSPNGKPGFILIRGDDYTGVTVTLQTSSVNDTGARWEPMVDGVFSANADVPLEDLPADLLIRAVLAGAGAGDNITVEVLQ